MSDLYITTAEHTETTVVTKAWEVTPEQFRIISEQLSGWCGEPDITQLASSDGLAEVWDAMGHHAVQMGKNDG